jgi:myo-inositol catabolism protein IolC
MTGDAADQVLLILAADHRNSLERELYGLTEPPSPAEAARIAADKLLVYQALLDAAAQLPEVAQPGILIDEQYGATVAELAARSGGAVRLAMPVEASGEQWFHFAYGEHWRAHAAFFAADNCKVLVRDNPGLAALQRGQQAHRLAQVSSWAAEHGRPLILELLVPATDSDKAGVGGDTARYDAEVRPRHTLDVIRYLQDQGVEPALWKIEGLDSPADAAAVCEAAARNGRRARCIAAGRHAPRGQLGRWLDVSAPVPGFTGFAIGRSIWWDALSRHLAGHATAAQARDQIAAAYLGYARDYLRARERS